MVVDLNATDASVKEIAEAASDASDKDLSRARGDPSFQFVSDLLVPLPLLVSAPDFEEALADLRGSSDVGEMAKVSFLECLSVQLHDKLPSLFEPTPQEMRKALVKFASGDTFAKLARDFFARLTYRSLDHYLCRELANHIAEDRRFATDAQRVAFQQAIAQHTFEVSGNVKEYPSGWYGQTVWQKQAFDRDAIDDSTAYAFKKMRSKFGRRRAFSRS